MKSNQPRQLEHSTETNTILRATAEVVEELKADFDVDVVTGGPDAYAWPRVGRVIEVFTLLPHSDRAAQVSVVVTDGPEVHLSVGWHLHKIFPAVTESGERESDDDAVAHLREVIEAVVCGQFAETVSGTLKPEYLAQWRQQDTACSYGTPLARATARTLRQKDRRPGPGGYWQPWKRRLVASAS